MSAPRPFSGEEIVDLVTEVAEALPSDGHQRVIIVVGGSLLAWHGLRASTLDVDSIERLDDELRRAVATVAARHDLAVAWLNDRAVPWRPATFETVTCTTLLDHPRLLVLGASLRDVFLMKLDRANARDLADLVALWPHVAASFPTAVAVVAAYTEAFPASPEDPELRSFVIDIASRAGSTLARS